MAPFVKAIATSLGECRFASPIPTATDAVSFVPVEIDWPEGRAPADPLLLERAAPRSRIFFDPANVRAGIVTCGGLCPGLNNVIRSAVLELHYGYGVRSIVGFRLGYGGLDPRTAREPFDLTPDVVDDIHLDGGTMLGTSRGPVDVPLAVENLVQRGINLLLCVGGDGTQRGGAALYEEARRRGHALAVVGVPKTIDNDIRLVDRTFGFTTAVEEARRVLSSAHTEARSVENGVSLVKLMGRNAGFIAAAATVASQDVNFCLIPEQPFHLEGPDGLLAALGDRLKARGHALIVVAEGAGQELIPSREAGTDASGNRKLQDIGHFLKEQIAAWSKTSGVPVIMRYFDPGYEIRGRAANTEDSILSDRYARHAVHAAMAGRTGLVIGLVHGRFAYVPVEQLDGPEKRVDLDRELWQAVLATTGQRRAFAGIAG
jgi:6-phosphofructokinase 1